jgi:hypothetical protein
MASLSIGTGKKPDWIKMPFTAFWEAKNLIAFLLLCLLRPNAYRVLKTN